MSRKKFKKAITTSFHKWDRKVDKEKFTRLIFITYDGAFKMHSMLNEFEIVTFVIDLEV